jgi:hypothetical protein
MGQAVTAGRRPHRTRAPDTGGPAARQPTALRGLADQANADRRHRGRDLDRCLNGARLLDCGDALTTAAASGGDGGTWHRAADTLQTKVAALVERRKRKRSRATLLRRHDMPQGNGHARP